MKDEPELPQAGEAGRSPPPQRGQAPVAPAGRPAASAWRPQIGGRPGARYLAIVSALEEDIDRGRLGPGDRLPTHRALARALGVNVGTVTRAYSEAERRGLIAGEVGRGTFVRAGAGPAPAAGGTPAAPGSPARSPGPIDLAAGRPVLGPQSRELARALNALSERLDLEDFLVDRSEAGSRDHRRAGAAWIGRAGLTVEAEQIAIAGGGQHALIAALAAFAGPGAVVLCESLTQPGVKAAARLLRLELEGLVMDDEGIKPESFELACWSRGARVLICAPTLHTPTTAVMSETRRREIVDIAERYDVTIIEDGIQGILDRTAPPPLAALAPERCCFLASPAETLAPGLRIAYAAAPPGRIEPLITAARTSAAMAAPIMAEIAARWIADGTAERLLDWQREQAGERRAVAMAQLSPYELVSRPGARQGWLHLPRPWLADEFADHARARGILVAPAGMFAAGRSAPPQAVRISFGACDSTETLRRGLTVLAELLSGPPGPQLPLV